MTTASAPLPPTSHRAEAHRIAELELETQALRDRCAALEQLVRLHDLLPLPPPQLRARVGGFEDADHFLGVGRKICWDVKRLLRSADRSFAQFAAVLDFGCGCGRLTRHLLPEGEQRITGCDIDPESIAWCAEHLTRPGIDFVLTSADPPLPFADCTFDLAIAISVFSHLPEDRQHAWLAELHRVIAPGGVLIGSVHGETLLPPDTPAETRERLAHAGFLYAKGFGTPGLPDFYQTAYHRPDYVRAQWQRGFELAFELPRGINNHQDAYVLVRRDT
jgi:SAM-dependent methyltransferase